MPACYILSYYVHGECAVDVNSVQYIDETDRDHCTLKFKDGSTLQLEEGLEAYNLKRPRCRTADRLPEGIRKFPG